MLNALIDKFQATWTPNRLVAAAMALLIPLAIAPAAGYVAVWIPQHFPGLPTFTTAQLTAFGIAGVSAALLAGVTAGYQWIDGWQKHENRQAYVKDAEAEHRRALELAAVAAPDPFHAINALDTLTTGEKTVAGPSTTASPTAVIPPAS